jgi:hypothetical protein
MKKKTRQSNIEDIRHAPAYCIAGQQLFQRLRAALTNTLGFQPGFARLARMLGENLGLTHYWFHALPQKHVVAFLTLLERLPEPKRWEVINEWCRELPMLDHPRLAHDPLAVSSMGEVHREVEHFAGGFVAPQPGQDIL